MTKKSFTIAATNAVIHDGFADGINALNKTIVSQHMRPFMDGRGYAKPDSRYGDEPPVHTSLIHAMSFGEDNPEQLFQSLERRNDTSGSIYMGAAGLLNLSFMAATRPGAAILFDINPVQAVFWREVLSILAEEKNGGRFMDALVKATPRIHHAATSFHQAGQHPMLSYELRDNAYLYGISTRSMADAYKCRVYEMG